MKRLLVTGLTTAALAVTPVLVMTAGTAAPSAAQASDTDGTYVPVTPTRLLDTRSTGKVAPGATKTVQITGRAGIPTTGVSAAVVNLTVTGPTKPGFLSAYPGTTFPGTSALNFAAGETRANLVTVPVSDAGTITVLNGTTTGAAPANVLLDVQGYYLEDVPSDTAAAADAPPAQFYSGYPERVLDTRGGEDGPLFAGETLYQDLSSEDFDVADVTALAVNVTAVNPTFPGYLQAWDGVGQAPNSSILNFAKGRTTPNNTVVPVAFYEDGMGSYIEFAIRNGSSGGATDVLVDVVGTYAQGVDGLVFRPLASPVRMVDTRSGKGATKFGPNQTKSIVPSEEVQNPDNPLRTQALVGNLTAVGPTAATYLTVWPEDDRPAVSNLNPAKGQTVANHSYIALSGTESGEFNVYNNAGSTNLLIDVTGYFDASPSGFAKRSTTAGSRSMSFTAVTRKHSSAR